MTMPEPSNTSIEMWWSFPSLPECCAGVAFSYPLVTYYYREVDFSFDIEVSCYYMYMHAYICTYILNNNAVLQTAFWFEHTMELHVHVY